MPTSTWAGKDGALYSVPPALGQTGGCLGRWALRPIVVAPHADVAEQPSLGRQVVRAQESQGVAALPPLSVTLEGQGLFPDGCAHGLHPIPPGDRHHRCMSIRVGCSAAGQGRTVQGQWSAQEGARHVNVLELRAVQLALTHFLPQLGGKHVLVPWDSMYTVAQTAVPSR